MNATGWTDKNKMKERVNEVVSLVGLKGKNKELPYQISGGEQQRVVIARAIINNPQLIIADEPTGNLDPDLSLELMELFMEINKKGTTVIIATHDLFLIKRLRKRVLVMDSGQMIDDYRPDQ